jgi:hypothetical protein
MPKVNAIQTNMSGGEVSPLLWARVDTAKYQNGMETVENMIVMPGGGARKRMGTKFVWYDRNSVARSRLVPFSYNAEQSYVLEFGASYIRFYTNGGVLTQTAQNITGITATNPAVVTYAGSDTYANGDRVAITGVLGMTELNNREFTVANVNAGANTFELSGVDATLYTPYTSGGTVAEIIEVTTTYAIGEIQALSFCQSADTLFIAHPDHPIRKLVRNSATSWTLSVHEVIRGPWRSLNPDETVTIKSNDTDGTVTLQASSSLFHTTQVGGLFKLYTPTRTNGESEFGPDEAVNSGDYWSYNGNVYEITAQNGGAMANSMTVTPPTHKQGTVRLYSQGSSSGRWSDAKFVHMGYGIVEIDTYVSGTEVTGTVYSGYGYLELPLQMVDPSMTGGLGANSRYSEPTKFWQEGAWSDYRGYPEQITFYEQRLMASQVQTVYGSVSGNFSDFEEGTNDDQAINYTLASEQVDTIRWMNPGKQLLIGTTGGEYSMSASSLNEALTPKNVKISRETSYGSSPCNPVRVGNAVLFMQRRGDPANPGRKMREMGYDFQSDSFVANDLTIFAPHITGEGVEFLAYQPDPDSLIWGVRTDGKMCAITYERAQEVTAWHRHVLGGFSTVDSEVAAVESVACIPGTNGDELWLKVKRYVEGQTIRTIEVLSYFDDETDLEDGIFTDCAMTYSGASTDTITGLWPLRAREVSYLADGVVGSGVVSVTGTLTLSEAASKVHIGYGYVSKLKTLDFEAGAAGGTAQGRQKRISAATVRLHRSQGGTVGIEASADAIDYSDQTDPLALYTGDRTVTMRSGWDGRGHVYVEHRDPTPFTVLAIMPELNVTG